MALDICFDIKTFLERTCRACSRYFGDDEIKFHRIFTDGDISITIPTHSTGSGSKTNTEEQKDEKPNLLHEDVKDIYEELLIWKLNIKLNDGLPQQICHDCLNRFRSVKLFREECLDTQKVLESYFKDFDTLLETGSLSKSPKAESIKSEARASPDIINSFNSDDLVEEVPESPERQSPQNSPFDSPKFRDSPKFNESAYTESLLGTPPPLFEEIKTEPIDMCTMECMKAEADLPMDVKLNGTIKQEYDEDSFMPLTRKTPPHSFHYSSSDDESSTPTSDDENENISSSDGEDSEVEAAYRHKKDQKYKPRNPLQCKICYIVFSNRSLLKDHHLHAHPQEKPYECNLCSSSFKSHFLLSQHKHKHNRPDTIKCELCSKYFRSQLHLQRHAKNFHLTSNYTCHICHEKFENYTQLRFQYHVRQHGEKRFQCQFCEKSFHQKIHLSNHERTHTKEQPFRCDICGKCYRQQTVCQEHMLKHKDPTPHKCKFCQKAFTQRSALRLHYRTHPNHLPSYNCGFCGQNFTQKQRYDMHQMTHNSVYSVQQINYDCQHCGSTFTQQSHLNDHMQAVHIKKRAHTCGFCGKAFALKSGLKAHMKSHTSASRKSMNCQFLNCGKSFQTKQMLLLHEQQHNNDQEKRFQCSLCSETFLSRAILDKHLLSHLENDNGYHDDLINYNFNSSLI